MKGHRVQYNKSRAFDTSKMDRYPERKSIMIHHTLGQMDLKDIYRTFHPKATEYVFFLSVHNIHQATKQVLTHLRRLKLYQVFFVHNDKLKISNEEFERVCKHIEILKMFLNNQWTKEEM